jgi:two-component system response regulator FlrC
VPNGEEPVMAIKTHILLVDDDGSLLATLRTCLEMADYHCMEAKDGYDAPDWLEKDHPIDLIVIDHQMPSVFGLKLINGLKAT